MDNNQLPALGFQITRILDCGFFIEEAIKPTIDNTEIGYGMNFSFSINDSWIEYLIRADLKEKDTNAMFLSGTVLTRFSINNLVGFQTDDGKLNFPEGSLEVLFGIAFGHLRAIVSKNVGGSKFRDFIIPPINQHVLFNELLQANIERFKHEILENNKASVGEGEKPITIKKSKKKKGV